MDFRQLSFPDAPLIKSVPPGPKSKEFLDFQTVSESAAVSYPKGMPMAIQRAKGATVEDVDGNVYIDFFGGAGVMNVGHSNPRVMEAANRQISEFTHSLDIPNAARRSLVEILRTLLPDSLSKLFFGGPTGSDAVEAAMKLSRYKTGRSQFIAFYGSFHGRTLGALSLTASKTVQKKGFFPFVPGVTHIPYGYCYRCPYGQVNDPTQEEVSCNLACVEFLEDTIFRCKVDPKDVAAVIIEPIQGEGGYVVPPVKFLQGIRKTCDKYGILLVMDEIQAGMGRTGKWFASEHFGVEPDIITVAKGIASGMPLGGIITSEEVMNWDYGAHASTFGGNPVAREVLHGARAQAGGFDRGAGRFHASRPPRTLDQRRGSGGRGRVSVPPPYLLSPTALHIPDL